MKECYEAHTFCPVCRLYLRVSGSWRISVANRDLVLEKPEFLNWQHTLGLYVFSGYIVCLYNEDLVCSQLYFSCSFPNISSPKCVPSLHCYSRE